MPLDLSKAGFRAWDPDAAMLAGNMTNLWQRNWIAELPRWKEPPISLGSSVVPNMSRCNRVYMHTYNLWPLNRSQVWDKCLQVCRCMWLSFKQIFFLLLFYSGLWYSIHIYIYRILEVLISIFLLTTGFYGLFHGTGGSKPSHVTCAMAWGGGRCRSQVNSNLKMLVFQSRESPFSRADF